MPRIAGVDLPASKRTEIAHTSIYGVGRSTSDHILEACDIDPDTRVADLAETQIADLRPFIDRNYAVEGDPRRQVRLNVQRLQEIGSYHGIRHRKGLPVRGQRTRTNAPTRKGRPKTVAGRRRSRAET